MSDPSWAWMSVARSGVRRWEEPSRCELNFAPSSPIVQTAASRDEIVAWPQVQMIGIAQEYRRAGGVQILMRHTLHRPLRSNRHEGGRLHFAVRSGHDTAARVSVRVRQTKRERW